jgi:hypothetical protein
LKFKKHNRHDKFPTRRTPSTRNPRAAAQNYERSSCSLRRRKRISQRNMESPTESAKSGLRPLDAKLTEPIHADASRPRDLVADIAALTFEPVDLVVEERKS